MRTQRTALALMFLLSFSASVYGQFDPFNPGGEFDQFGETVENPQQAAAETAYKRGDFAGVISITTSMIEAEPENPVAWHLQASAKVELGRATRSSIKIREGIEDARKALGLAGKTHPWLYVPYLYGMSGLSELEGRPDHARTAVKVVTPLLEKGDLTESIRIQLLFQRALAHHSSGETASAIADYSATLKLSPKHLAAYVKRSQAQKSAGELKAALAGLDVALKQIPESAMLYNERGMLHRANGDLPRAVSDFSTALRVDPKFTVAYINRGACELDRNAAAVAERDFSEGLRLQPQNAVLFHYRGTARTLLGKLAEAEGDFSAALRLDPKNALALSERGYVQFSRKKFAEASDDFAKALSVDPKEYEFALWRAVSLDRAGKSEASVQAVDELLKQSAAETGWTGVLAGYWKGAVDEDALMQAAVDDKGESSPSRQCEAWFFIAQKKLEAGDQSGAREPLEKAVATNLPLVAAFRVAKAALAMK